jgi:hypothetical protein
MYFSSHSFNVSCFIDYSPICHVVVYFLWVTKKQKGLKGSTLADRRINKKGRRPSLTDWEGMVAGAGFEPTTFGL